MFSTIRRLFGFGPREPKQLSEDKRAKLRESTGGFLHEGLANAWSAEVVRENALNVFSGELPDEELAADIDTLLPGLDAERKAAVANWPEVTDCDRLDAAFAEIKASGLIAEQNFWCCQACASSDVHSIMKQARKSAVAIPRGYVFYHEQDTESAVCGHGLFLAFGSWNGQASAFHDIALEVIATLKEHGFDPEWNAKLDQRIFLPLDWKRRCPLPKSY